MLSNSLTKQSAIVSSDRVGHGRQSQAAPAPAVPTARRPTWLRRLMSVNGLFFTLCAVLLIFGWRFPTHRYITPQTGVGYALGITGGSLMLLLLLYPARKRWRWLSFMGSVKGWFQTHMVLGLVGPICILYHSNFSTGAVNSNVALFCMLTVSGSGLVGRYFYTRIHHGLSERATTMAELQGNADRLRSVSMSVAFLPELLDRLLLEEKQLLQQVARCPMLFKPPYAFCLSWLARGRLNRYVHRALRTAAQQSAVLARQQQRLSLTARGYIAQRIGATREVSEFQAYTQLFSLWHVLHLPLFFMLLMAGIVHVIAVHVY
ncbi:MAG: hypothetical protein AB7I12_09310 [Steroidobacteraceae bacterium]